MRDSPQVGDSETGLLSNQGEKSIHFYFIMVPLRKKVLKYGTPKPRKPVSLKGSTLAVLGLTVYGVFKILW